MIKVTIALEGGKLELDKRLLRATMRAAGNEVARLAKAMIRSSDGAGRKYFLGPGHTYRASAPGQAPVSRTGRLDSNIKVRVFPSGEGVAIRADKFYARFLETGARGGVGSGKKGAKGRRNKRGAVAGQRVLLPRPFLTVALEQREASIAQRVADSINQGVKFKKMRVKP